MQKEAKCTNCGKIVKIEATKDAAVCEYCGAAFVVEKAIKDYNAEHALVPTPTTDLKKYLSDVLEREQVLFTLKQIQAKLKGQIKQVTNNKVVFPTAPTVPAQAETFYDLPNWAVWVGGVIAVGCFLFSVVLGLTGAPSEIITPWQVFTAFGVLFAVIGVVIGVIKAKIDAAESNNSAQEWYEKAQELYIEDLESAKIKSTKLETEKTPVLAKLNEKLAEVDSAIIKTKSVLDALYSLGVIGEKYRHFVPVASFCEYVQYDRCDNMGSAYNLYESELRQNMIIGHLGAVIEGLENIRDGQYMLYQAVSEANSINKNVISEIQGLKNTVGKVAATSTMTTYFAKQSADNSRLLVDINRGAYGFLCDKTGRIVF